MEKTKRKKTKIEQAGEDLFDFAIDRSDTKTLMGHLHKEADINRTKIEYELQILRIVSVGWSISYYLENAPYKNDLVQLYWMAIHGFSQDISSTSGLLTGKDINYFQILKDRLDTYLKALGKSKKTEEPVMVIGPKFAEICGNGDDVFTIMTGSRMFTAAIVGVKEYFTL